MRGPEAAEAFESSIRALVKSRVPRGHVEVRLSLPSAVAGRRRAGVESAAAGGVFQCVSGSRRRARLGRGAGFECGAAGSGNVCAAEERGAGRKASARAHEALDDALEQLNVFREREGAEIVAEMRKHNARVGAAAGEMEKIRESATEAFQSRLQERLQRPA